ncbi:type III-B CRISPR module-associated Cmr3 family protein [Teredinibacter turnerae]|uniref:type III-B CRISPR module-associated Cmr3 family protein n=1 Tax=Teredinibacter turnerae TaxID=2426 RepID=UPI0030CE932F
MAHHFVRLTPRDPLIARDGRPFGASSGNRMRSLPWFYPSLFSGSLRSLLGKATGGFSTETVAALKALEISGPLALLNNTLFFPRPLDARVFESGAERHCYGLRPGALGAGEGVDLPGPNLLPTLLPDGANMDGKPAEIAQFWSSARMADWLTRSSASGFTAPPDNTPSSADTGYLAAPPVDFRTHTALSDEKGVADDGKLFITAGLDLNLPNTADIVQLVSRVGNSGWCQQVLEGLAQVHPMGGDRRLANWQHTDDQHLWECPQGVASALARATKIRLYLATPGLFDGGWLPGWLDKTTFTGCPPGIEGGLKLTLRAVCSERWQPLSGWSLERDSWGPKAARRMVPAGSVYFFTCEQGDAAQLVPRWLSSVCDKAQDRNDGFGLALWGTWDEHKN